MSENEVTYEMSRPRPATPKERERLGCEMVVAVWVNGVKNVIPYGTDHHTN